MDDKELVKNSYALYKKLGGEQNEVARVLRMLWERWEAAEAAQPHPTVATGCPFCGAEAEDIELLNESLASDRNSR